MRWPNLLTQVTISMLISQWVGSICSCTRCSSLSCFQVKTSCSDPLITQNIFIKCQLSTAQFWTLCQLYHYELSLPGQLALENLLKPESSPLPLQFLLWFVGLLVLMEKLHELKRAIPWFLRLRNLTIQLIIFRSQDLMFTST